MREMSGSGKQIEFAMRILANFDKQVEALRLVAAMDRADFADYFEESYREVIIGTLDKMVATVEPFRSDAEKIINLRYLRYKIEGADFWSTFFRGNTVWFGIRKTPNQAMFNAAINRLRGEGKIQ